MLTPEWALMKFHHVVEWRNQHAMGSKKHEIKEFDYIIMVTQSCRIVTFVGMSSGFESRSEK